MTDINEIIDKNTEQSILQLFLLIKKLKYKNDKKTVSEMIGLLKRVSKKNEELALRVYYKNILKK